MVGRKNIRALVARVSEAHPGARGFPDPGALRLPGLQKLYLVPGDIGHLNEQGGWAIELQVMFLATAAAIALLGPGRRAFNQR